MLQCLLLLRCDVTMSADTLQDETDVRACVTALLMKLLQAEDEDLIRSLVEQRGMEFDHL